MHANLSKSRSMVSAVLTTLVMASFLVSGKAGLAEDAAKQAAAVASWTLTTDDTKLTLGVGAGPAVVRL